MDVKVSIEKQPVPCRWEYSAKVTTSDGVEHDVTFFVDDEGLEDETIYVLESSDGVDRNADVPEEIYDAVVDLDLRGGETA